MTIINISKGYRGRAGTRMKAFTTGLLLERA